MLWYIALGGAAGSVARYLLGILLQARSGSVFPIGTLVVNITGSFLLGFLLRYALGNASVSPEVRALVTTGFCGGYTTFSTFSLETIAMIEEGDLRRASVYVLLSVAISLLGALAGVTLAKEVLSTRHGLGG